MTDAELRAELKRIARQAGGYRELARLLGSSEIRLKKMATGAQTATGPYPISPETVAAAHLLTEPTYVLADPLVARLREGYRPEPRQRRKAAGG